MTSTFLASLTLDSFALTFALSFPTFFFSGDLDLALDLVGEESFEEEEDFEAVLVFGVDLEDDLTGEEETFSSTSSSSSSSLSTTFDLGLEVRAFFLEGATTSSGMSCRMDWSEERGKG